MKMAGKPADKEHPFGHGRIEYIAALIVSFLVLEVGFTFFEGFCFQDQNPGNLEFSVDFGSDPDFYPSELSYGSVYLIKKLGKKIDSKVMMAVFTDSMGDVITTGATILSLIVFRNYGLEH